MPRALSFRVEIDVRSIAAEINKELVNLRENTRLEGQLLNDATSHDGKPLFTFLDRGTKRHVIDPGPSGYLADKDDNFIVRGPVTHPGIAPHDITSRTFNYFESVYSRAIIGASTRALSRRTGTAIDYDAVRAAFTNSLLSAKHYAESITPNNWQSVKSSYKLKVNGRFEEG